MTRQVFVNRLMETVRTSAMIFTILIGAILLNNFLVLSAVPDAVGDWIGSLALSSTAILFIILLIYLVMGCALDFSGDDPTNNPNLFSGDTTIGHGSGLVWNYRGHGG